jgi:hypothetical protein
MTSTTCVAMRDRMLEAEPDELEGVGASALALHVRECDACAAVAQRIVRDSRVLALAVQRAAPADVALFAARTRMPRRSLVGGAVAALAASVVLAVLVQNGIRGYAQTDGSFAVIARAPALTPDVGPRRPDAGVLSSPVLGAGLAAPVSSVAVDVAPVHGVRVADVDAVSAVPFVVPSEGTEPAMANERSVVSVTPPRGRRAAVMQGRNAKVTVVWFY